MSLEEIRKKYGLDDKGKRRDPLERIQDEYGLTSGGGRKPFAQQTVGTWLEGADLGSFPILHDGEEHSLSFSEIIPAAGTKLDTTISPKDSPFAAAINANKKPVNTVESVFPTATGGARELFKPKASGGKAMTGSEMRDKGIIQPANSDDVAKAVDRRDKTLELEHAQEMVEVYSELRGSHTTSPEEKYEAEKQYQFFQSEVQRLTTELTAEQRAHEEFAARQKEAYKAEYEEAKAAKDASDKYIYGKLQRGEALTPKDKADREFVLKQWEQATEKYVPGGWLQGAFQQVGGAFANVLPTAVELGNEAKRADVKPLSPVDTGDPEMDAYLAQIGGAADKAVARPEGALLDDEELQSWQQKADELTERGQYRIEMSKAGTSKAEQTLIDIGVGATQLLGDIALGTATGVGVMPVMAIRSFGGGAQEARQNGATVQQQFLYGIASAGVEVITEKIFGGPQLFQKAYGAGFLDNVVNRLTKKLTTKSGQVAWLTAKSFLEEGTEEFIASIVNPFISTIYKEDALKEAYGNGDAFQTTVANALYDALIGGVLGFAGFAVNAKGEMRNLQQQVAMAELEKMVSIDKLGQEFGGEVSLMVKALTESQTYAEGTASRTLGRDLREALYELIDSNDSAGVRNFFKANKAQFDKLLKVMTLESDKIVPAEQDPRRNGTLGELATQSEETQSEDSYSRVMDSTETKVYEALTAKGFSSGEATAVFEYVARIVDGDITLTNNDITERARVGKDPRIIEVINELTGSNLNVNEKSRSKVKAEVRDVIAKVAAAKEDARIAEAQQSAVADVEQMVAETRASVPLEQVFTPAQQASPAAAPTVEPTAAEQSGADKFMAFAKGEAEAEIQPQSEYTEDWLEDENIKQVLREQGVTDDEARALLRNYEAGARAAGVDPVADFSSFIRYSVDEQVENYVNVGNITDEQKLARDILKASLADLGIKDVVLVTGDARMVGSNGSYVGGVVTINADRINTQTYSGIAWTVGHEIVHAAEDADGGRKANGVTVRNAKIVNDIFDVMRVLADAGAIEGRYAEITRDEKSLAALIDKKKNVEHRFLMRDWVDENGVFHKGMTKQQAERRFNDFDARAEIAADFLGSMLGHNFKHEREGRFGSKFGTSDIFAMMEETAPETTSWIHDKLNSIRDRLRGYDAKTAAERKAKATMQRHLTKLSKELAEAISKGAQKNAAQTSDVRNAHDDGEISGYNPNLKYYTWEKQVEFVENKIWDTKLRGNGFRRSVMYVMESPTQLLQQIGFEDYPLVTTVTHYENMRAQRWDANGNVINQHNHELSRSFTENIPKYIDEAVAIFKSDTKYSPGGVVILTPEVDAKGDPVTITLTPNQPHYVYDGEQGAAHFVNAFGRANFDSYITGVFKNGNVIYVNKKRAYALKSQRAAKIRRHIASSGIKLDTIIQQKDPSVNTNLPPRRFSVDDSEYAAPMYSKLERELDGVKQNKLGASSVVSMLRGKGVKAEEIKWSGIEQFLEGKKSVTKQELLDFVRGNQLEITEAVRDDSQKIKVKKLPNNERGIYVDGELVETFTKGEHGFWYPSNPTGVYDFYTDEKAIAKEFVESRGLSTKWSEYKLDGGKNYREIVFSLPNSSYTNDAMQGHWGDNAKGILAHARVQDFKVNGKKMLFIEEIQSDWHNEGKRSGYNTKGVKTDVDIRKESATAYREFYNSDVMQGIEQRLFRNGYGNAPTLFANVIDGEQSAIDIMMEYAGPLSENEISFIRKAISEEGRRQKALESAPKAKSTPDAPYKDNYHEYVLKKLLRTASEQGYDSIGWTPAKVQSERWSDEFAEGYRIEYDQDIPKFLKKYGKQWGAEVETATLRNGTEVWSMDITDAMRDSVLYEGQPRFSVDDGEYAAPMYSKLQREIEAFKGDRIGASSAVSYLRGKGVKAEEIKWSGIETYLEGKKSVNKQELLDWLKANELTLTATVLGGENNDYYHLRIPAMNPETGEVIADWADFENQAYELAEMQGYDWNDVRFDEYEGWWQAYINDPETGLIIDLMEINADAHNDTTGETHWESYTTGDANNYREILWKMPQSDYSNRAMGAHWDGEAGVVVHARIDDQRLTDGSKALFIEEIQSDWHNEGAQMGYADSDATMRAYEAAEEADGERANMYNDLFRELEAFYSEYGIDTPRAAAEQHLDMAYNNDLVKIFNDVYKFPPKLQASLDRYFELDKKAQELSVKVSRAERGGVPDAPYAKTYHEYALKNLLRMAAEEGYDALAWTPAYMQSERWSDEYAEGYRIEYDQDIPKFLNKYGKQWGAKVERIGLDGVDTGIVDEAYIDSLTERNYEIIRKLRTIQNEAEAAQLMSEAQKLQEEIRKARLGTVWAIPITPEMKRSVLYEGQPRFSVDDTLDKTAESEYSTISNSEEAKYGNQESTDNRGRQDLGRADNQPHRDGSGESSESGGRNGRGNLGRIERTVIPEKTRKILDDKGIPNVELEETTDRDAFSVALENAKAANPNGGMVDSQSPEDMQKNGSRTFMRADGNAGVAVERDGNIVGVFKNPEYKERGAVYDLILTAIANEGNHLDCYSTYTPADLRTKYARMGFEPVCYLEFNREYAPDGWNYEAWGEPDVVLWVHNGDTVEQIVERTERYHVPTRGEIHALPKFEDYDEAKAYQAQKVEEMLQSKARTETLSKLFRYSVDDTTEAPVKEAEAPTEPELTPQQIRGRDRAEAIRRVFTAAREMYGDDFVKKMSEDTNTKAGIERLNQVFRPAADQARAEQRTRDDLRLQRERTREAERRREMRKAFNLEKQDIRKEEREKARIDKMAALAVQEQKLDDKWKARMEAKVDKVKAQAEERLRIKMRKADFIRAYENLAAEIREKKAKAEGKRKAAEERRRGNERISEQRVLSRTTAKEARRVLSQSRNTGRPDYTNSEVETLRQLRPDDVSTEQVTTLADKLRNARKRLYRAFVNQAQTIDNFSKLQIDGVRAGSLVNMIFGSASTIETIYQNGLVARDGTHLGNAMKEVFLVRNADGSIDQEKQAILQDYMLFVHNIDRMSFSERALARVEAMEAQHPWLVDIGAKEFAYAAGLNDAETEATGTDERRGIVREYAAALKALNEAKDKPIFADKDGKPVSAETSREIVARYEEEHPWLKEKAEGIYEWWDSFMREWAVGNTLSAEAYDTWKQMYPHYVPTYRMSEGGPEGAIQIGPASASINDLYKAAKGSTKPVKNIEESFSTLVRKIVDTSRKNELLRNIIDTAMLDTEGVFGDFAIFDWDGYYESNPEYGEAMENAAWLNGDSISAVESAHVEAIEELDGGYRITAYGMDGGRYSAWVSKEMYRALVAVTNTSKLLGEGANTLTRIGSKLTTPMKSMITGYNPNFAIRNVMRDIPTAIVNGISGFAFPKYAARAFMHMKNNSETWQQFKALGGTHFGYYGMSTDWAARMEKKPGLGAKALDKLGTLGESTESITRFAEYLATIDKLGDTYEGRVQGIKNAAEVTVDFSRKGEYGKLANAWIPYWNPAVQGIDKLFRQIFDNSTSVKQKFAVSGVTLTRGAIIAVLPELLQYLLLKAFGDYDEWEKLSDRMKDSYFCIPIAGEHKFFKIPKTREWGTLLGTPLMRMLEGFNGRSDPFENYVEDALLANFSVSGVVDAIGISTIIDLRTNKDFAGRDIVPYAYQEASASKQYDADTSAIAYGVATAWNKSFAKIAEALGKEVELSPMQLDYIINDYCGDFYYMLAQMVPVGLFDGSTSLKEIFGGILGSMEGTWVGDNRYSNYYTGEYYDILDYLDRSIADEKLMNPEDYTNSYVFKLDKAFNEAYGKQLSELNKQAAQLPDGEEKDSIKEQIADLAFEAVEWFRNESINNSDDPFLRVSYGDFSNELQDALIDLDSFSGDYYFKPSPSTSKSYTDPHNKGKEYVLTEEQYAQYKTFYMEAYDEIMTRAVKSYQYKRLSEEEKAEYLDEARDAVHEKAKEELFTWLRRNGVKSTYKAD